MTIRNLKKNPFPWEFQLSNLSCWRNFSFYSYCHKMEDKDDANQKEKVWEWPHWSDNWEWKSNSEENALCSALWRINPSVTFSWRLNSVFEKCYMLIKNSIQIHFDILEAFQSIRWEANVLRESFASLQGQFIWRLIKEDFCYFLNKL